MLKEEDALELEKIIRKENNSFLIIFLIIFLNFSFICIYGLLF